MEINLNRAKRLVSLVILASIVMNGWILLASEMHEGDLWLVRGMFGIAILIYQGRYLYLVNRLKRHTYNFQLMAQQPSPLVMDTLASIILFAIMPSLLTWLHIWLRDIAKPFDWVALGLYLSGTAITLISEGQRRRWKQSHPERVYRDGLFRLANHINYFGEIFTFSSLCWLTTGLWWVFLLAFVYQFFDFAYMQIPKQEAYRQRKYPADHELMKHRKKLIPFIY